ncbi:MAG: nuclear transport factor 2 family protein [Luteimonas sp.]|nr:nuclear transport factor 2 family protein [Luteimonas sp.]
MHALNRIGATVILCGLAWGMSGTAVSAEAGESAGDCFAAAFKAQDAEGVAACYAEDAVLWFPGGPMAKGRAAIRDGFMGYFQDVTIKDIAMTTLGEQAVGDARASWGTYAITSVNKATSAETVEHGRYTDVSKLIDGRWLYVVDHPSDDPPAD